MKNFKQKFKRQSLPEKILFFSLILSFFCTFLPWFYKELPTTGKENLIISANAYQEIAGVLGYFYILFILTAFVFLILQLKEKSITKFLEKKPWFFLFLTGESLFLLILSFLIYTSYSLQFARSGIKYGLFFAIIANIISFFASHFYYLEKNKNLKKQEFISNMQGKVFLEPEKEQLNLSDYS
jgi:cytochrome bd-type quinol oxidase subunit 1